MIADRAARLILFESEASRIAQLALSSPGIEIGGDLFGFYAPEGSPLVFVASGPGPDARGSSHHFHQDGQFQVQSFNLLSSQQRMFYIGDWHSHHEIALSEPSGSDDAKLGDLARKNHWPQLFSIIVQTGRLFDSAYKRSSQSGLANTRAKTQRLDDEEPKGPVEALGIGWNVFQYGFSESLPWRRRIALEIRPGHNPHAALATVLHSGRVPTGTGGEFDRNYPRKLGTELPASGSQNEGASAEPRVALDSAIVFFSKICRVLSQNLPQAEMQVDLSYGAGPRLIVESGGRLIHVSVTGHTDAALTVILSSDRALSQEFTVSRRESVTESSDVENAANRIISSLHETNHYV